MLFASCQVPATPSNTLTRLLWMVLDPPCQSMTMIPKRCQKDFKTLNLFPFAIISFVEP